VLRLVYDGLFDRHPELKLVVSHAGSLLPVLLGRIEYEGARLGAGGGLALPPAEAIRLLYTDTICAWPPALRLALDVFGPERVLFGSDAPFWAPAKSVETLTALALPPAVAAGIRAGNARRLFRLPVG
jgi:aminocarboxymuconate-semialdehyde decarboxylase